MRSLEETENSSNSETLTLWEGKKKMGEENEKNSLIECRMRYSLNDEKGEEIASGEVRVQLGEENISIHPKSGKALSFSYRDIVDLPASDYKIHLTLTSKEKITLSNLGYHYEDFLRELSKQRNEMLLKDLLMHESLKKSLEKAKVEADFVYFDENGKEMEKGRCQPRLYETALVIIPNLGELKRIPYSDLLEIQDEDYHLTLLTEFGEKIVFSKMGGQFDPFKKALSDSINMLLVKVQSSLKELLPKADPSKIIRASRLMKEGRAAKRSDLESISPELWRELEKKLEIAGIQEEYNFLESLAQKEKMAIGLKRGLLGDLTGEYIWFLIPIYSTNPEEPGNAVIMEATSLRREEKGEEQSQEGIAVEVPPETSLEGEGKATYLFRIVSRKDYPNFKNIEDLHRETDHFLKTFNRCMLSVNFRREPIYLPDKQLEKPQYQKYRFAIQKIPALQTLRTLFIGRVLHKTFEQWKEDVMDLLKFNVSIEGDEQRWKKGGV